MEGTRSPGNRATVKTRLGGGGAGQHPNFGLGSWVCAGESRVGEQPAWEPSLVGAGQCPLAGPLPLRWQAEGGTGPESGQRTPGGGWDGGCRQRGFPSALRARPERPEAGAPGPRAPPSQPSAWEAGGCLQHHGGRSGPGLLCKPQLLRGIPRSAPGSALLWSLHPVPRRVEAWGGAGLLPGVTQALGGVGYGQV